MLELKDIRKRYVTDSFTQVALDHVSVAFRDNEFVAVLGPSGSGKTTMLNIVGGLDHFDEGDLVIDGISTREYRDRDWDTYRNNRIGFVFQSYNLIPHQTILANVELALTLSGVGRAERRRRALDALARVGLADHVNKRPSQLSGGQMQRVAIARALINDPEILLADEPTGALDSATSVQVMDLLKEVAQDRLVVMVTHNPELARRYATRIVELHDGHITADSDPLDPDSVPRREARPPRRTSMSFLTALLLSFNNLMTKKGRTIMTAFAGSIGIIGIAAILALANGVNTYIANVEEETLSEYPLQIQSSGFDMTSLLSEAGGGSGGEGSGDGSSGDGQIGVSELLTSLLSSVGSNDLVSLKSYLDSGQANIDPYVNSIEYTYDVAPQIWRQQADGSVRQVNPDQSFSSLGLGSTASSNSLISMTMSTDVFYELPTDADLYQGQYNVKAGRWPEAANECVLVLTANGDISDFMQYTLGLRDSSELDAMVDQFAAEEEVTMPEDVGPYSYDDVLGDTFKLVRAADYYSYDADYGLWSDKREDGAYMRDLVANGEDLTIVGVVQPAEDATVAMLSAGIYYTPALTQHVIDEASQAQIVQDQLADQSTNVFTGRAFGEEDPDASFDMSSLFTIDGQAIEAAFTVDESALTAGMSGLDLDLSGISVDASSLPAFDPSQIQLDLSAVDPGSLTFDLSGLDFTFDGASPTVDGSKISAAMGEVMAGFMPWYQEHFEEFAEEEDPTSAALDAYLASDEVTSALSEAVAGAIDLTGMQEQIAAQLQAQLSEQISSQLREQLLPQIQQAITSQLQAQLSSALSTYVSGALRQMMQQMTSALETQVSAAMGRMTSQLAANMANAMHVDEDALAGAFHMNMDEQELAELMASFMSSDETTAQSNLRLLGYADASEPSGIDIYPVDFEGKGHVVEALDAYNAQMEQDGEKDKVITYTDLVGTLMSSVTTIIDMITAVLVAFVSISLVVSSIMIGVITYISVLERKKEIGILRSIGASKSDVSHVFNAETVIEGLIAGVLGVGVTALLCIPANAIIYQMFDVADLAQVPWQAGVALVVISVALTVIAGILPARKASHADPVEALRSE